MIFQVGAASEVRYIPSVSCFEADIVVINGFIYKSKHPDFPQGSTLTKMQSRRIQNNPIEFCVTYYGKSWEEIDRDDTLHDAIAAAEKFAAVWQ